MPEPIVVVLKSLFVWLIRWIPAWILRKKFHQQAVIEGFAVQLMHPTSINIRLDDNDPMASVYLRLFNLTPLMFEVEKLYIEIEIAGRKLARIDHAQRVRVDPYVAVPPLRYSGYSTMHDPKVYLHVDLDTGRAAAMRNHLKANPSRAEVKLVVFMQGLNQLGRFDSPPTEIVVPIEAASIYVT